jgi:HSP20 family molecular chaperone IbpA
LQRLERACLRQDLLYGSLSRTLPLAEGVTDITATYKAEILEIRIPEPKLEPVLTCNPPAG